MKLLNLYIENFGKLSKFEYSFSKPITTIKQDNGWGKTTLATFIKAMFYGLSNSGRDVEKNERKKFKPWQNGKFGGYLEFEIGNKKYRITRFFEGTVSNDTFSLKDLSTNKESVDYTLNIGQELFKLDADGFERSVFINNKNLEIKDKTSLTKRLSNLLENTDQDNNLATAQKQLDNLLTSLKNRQNNGLIPSVESKLSELSLEIENLQSIKGIIETNKKAIQELEVKIEKKEKELVDIKQNLSLAQQAKERKLIKERLHDLKSKVAKSNDDLKIIKKFFKNQEPVEQEINKLELKILDLVKLEASLTEKQLSDTISPQLIKIKQLFASGVPTLQDIKEIEQVNEQLTQINNQIKFLQTGQVSYKTENKNANKYRYIVCTTLFSLGIMFAVSGIVTLKSFLAIGVTFIVMATLLMFFGTAVCLKNKINSPTLKMSGKLSLQQLIQEQKPLEQKVKQFIHLFYNEGEYDSYYASLLSLQSNLNNYQLLTENLTEYKKQIEKLNQQKINLAADIENSLKLYNVEEFPSYSRAMSEIRKQYTEYLNTQKLLKERETDLANYLNDNDFIIDSAKEITFDLENLTELENLTQYDLDNLKTQKTELETKNYQLSLQADELPDKESEKELLSQKLSQYEQKQEILKHTIHFLAQAHDQITAKYLSPMQQSFNEYAQALNIEGLGKFELSTDLKLTIEQMGDSYETDYYSKGYRDLIELDLRFSLVNVLFEQEKPFIVLDDPFVSLDANKMEYARKLLVTLSKQFQIIYLTCHDSRII